MSSMKANIEAAADVLGVSVEALTERLLARDPRSTVDRDRRDAVCAAAISLRLGPAELVLLALDAEREDRKAPGYATGREV